MNRETVYSTLFAQLQQAAGFVTTSRTLKHWTDVPAAARPALFLAQGKETCITTAIGAGEKWELRPQVYLYVTSDGITPPSTLLNPLLDAVTNLINKRSPVTGTNRLGALIPGLVRACIDGTVESDEGTLGTDAVAIIPILLVVTDEP